MCIYSIHLQYILAVEYIATIFFLWVFFPVLLERKERFYPSKWKWIDGGYSNFVTPGSVPLRDEEAWNVL